MSDSIDRIKQRIEARKWKFTDDANVLEVVGMQYANNMNDWCLEIIDEESAKEPQCCEWVKFGRRERTGTEHYYRTSCGNTVDYYGHGEYCTHCGRKIEAQND